MIPKRIARANRYMGQPEGWEPETDGPCAHLAVRVSKHGGSGQVVCQSAWEPTPKELKHLNEGGSIVLTIVGGQPPVMLRVERVTEEALG